MAAQAQVVTISLHEAAQDLGRCALVSGTTVQELTREGFAFRLSTDSGGGVFVLEHVGQDRLWITAAEGVALRELTTLGLVLIEAIAVAGHCKEVAFETRRRGLALKAARRGYVVERDKGDSIVMKKAI